jgi:hypothetical protein
MRIILAVIRTKINNNPATLRIPSQTDFMLHLLPWTKKSLQQFSVSDTFLDFLYAQYYNF